MNLQRLSYLVLLAEERNFTRAADRARIAQPSFSRQIQKLETELGVGLVDRTTRHVSLTEQGRVVVEHARRVLAEVDALNDVINGSRTVLRGRITLGVTPTPGPVDVAGVLADFHHRHPVVEIAVREELSVRLAEKVRGDEIDIAIVSAVGRARPHGLAMTRIASDPVQLVVHSGHHLAQRHGVRFTELRDESFVLFRPPSMIRQAVVEACNRAGFAPRDQFETGDPWQAMRLAQAGLGVAFLPRHDITQRGGDVVAVSLQPTLRYDVYVAHRARRRLPPAAAQLLQEIATG